MTRQKILVVSDGLRQLPPAVAALAGCGHDVEYIDDLVCFPDIIAGRLGDLGNADAIVMGRVMNTDAAALALAGRARVIALHTSGSDNVDLAEATRRGITVTNVKGVNAEQCAEFRSG